MENTHQDIGRACGIGQRTEDIEDGANAHLLAHRCNRLHRRVMIGREHEADAGFLDAAPDLRRRQVELDPERGQDVGMPRRCRAQLLQNRARPAALIALGQQLREQELKLEAAWRESKRALNDDYRLVDAAVRVQLPCQSLK